VNALRVKLMDVRDDDEYGDDGQRCLKDDEESEERSENGYDDDADDGADRLGQGSSPD